MRKLFTWVLTVCLVVSLVSMSSFASEEEQKTPNAGVNVVSGETEKPPVVHKAIPAEEKTGESVTLVPSEMLHVEYIKENLDFTKQITAKYHAASTGSDSFTEKAASRYAYNDFTLRSHSSGRKSLYDALEKDSETMWNSTSNISKTGDHYVIAEYNLSSYSLSSDEAVEVYYMFRNDNPVYYFSSSTVLFSPEKLYYLVDEEYRTGKTRAEYQDKIQRYVKGYEDEIVQANAYGSLLNIHDRLNDDLEYVDDGSANAHNVVGAAVFGSGVCETYARMYELISNYYGLENMVVTGTGDGVAHIWNAVKLQNGRYYFVDCTYDDTGITDRYFAAGSDTMSTSHVANSSANTASSFLYDLPAMSKEDFVVPEDTTYNDGQLTYSITYGGRATVTGYVKDPVILAIPAVVNNAKVVSIGEEAFYQCDSLSDVTLPHSMKEIQTNAFLSCQNLKTINLPEGLKSIGQAALAHTAITSLVIPSTTTHIGASCFSETSKLKTIEVAQGNTVLKAENDVLYRYGRYLVGRFTESGYTVDEEVEGWAMIHYPQQKKDTEFTILDDATLMTSGSDFENNKYIKKFNAEKSMLDAGSIPCDVMVSSDNPYYAMVGNMILSKDKTAFVKAPVSDTGRITIPDSVNTIETGAFKYTNCSSIIVPDGVKTLESYAFSGAKAKSIILPDSIDRLGIGVFQQCQYLEEVNIPGSIEAIPMNTFLDCDSLEEIVIPEGVTTIGMQAFASSGTQFVSIPKSVKELGFNAFMHSTLRCVEFQGDVKSIGDDTFWGCSYLIAMSFRGTAPAFAEDALREVLQTEKDELTIYYPENNSWNNLKGKSFGSIGKVSWSPINCSDHHLDTVKKDMPTCTEDGEYCYECSKCGLQIDIPYILQISEIDDEDGWCSYSRLYLEATGHENGPAYVPATSDVPAHWHCRQCNRDFLDEECSQPMEGGALQAGDVNQDTNVDAKDLTVLARHLAKIEVITNSLQIKAADTNRDGAITALDLTLLAKYVAKIITTL